MRPSNIKDNQNLERNIYNSNFLNDNQVLADDLNWENIQATPAQCHRNNGEWRYNQSINIKRETGQQNVSLSKLSGPMFFMM
jgi:ActR/RegA family two-component response regulator